MSSCPLLGEGGFLWEFPIGRRQCQPIGIRVALWICRVLPCFLGQLAGKDDMLLWTPQFLPESGLSAYHSLMPLRCELDSMLPEAFWHDNVITPENKLA